MTKIRFRIPLLAVLLFPFMPLNLGAESALEAVVLKGNWQEVITTLEKDDQKVSDPVARLLMGHAYLATDKNNESLLLFLSARQDQDLVRWSDWTKKLLHTSPENPIALYLAADAEARQGHLHAADTLLSRASTNKVALILNARGNVRTLMKRWDEALMDLTAATRLAPKLADAQANLGNYWVMKETADGAIQAFDQAIAINANFALAYNGRGCAYFGKGEFDKAMADLDKAFASSPVLMPALSNQGIVLAAIAAKASQATAQTGTKPGTTLLTKSELTGLDYGSFTSTEQMTKFQRSAAEIGTKDPWEAVQVYSNQLAKLQNRIGDLSTTIQQMQRAYTAAGKAERSLHQLDQTLALMDVGKHAVNILPNTWKPYVDLARGTSEIVATAAPKDTAAAYDAGLATRSLSKQPFIAAIRPLTYAMDLTARTYGHIAETRELTALNELSLRIKQYDLLQQEQGHYVAEAIKRGPEYVNSKMRPALGDASRSLPSMSRGPIPQYAIPEQAPLTHFGVLPGAIGPDLSPLGKSPLVVIDGSTDMHRLGTLLRGFEERGVRALAVPTTMDAQSFARMTGADRVVKITSGAGTVAALRGTSSMLSPDQKVSGILTFSESTHIDLGQWPVLTSFTLLYPAPKAGEEPQ
jgi:tetratricopeptide (TPR) repeat protein